MPLLDIPKNLAEELTTSITKSWVAAFCPVTSNEDRSGHDGFFACAKGN
jgi:hypothetical protein